MGSGSSGSALLRDDRLSRRLAAASVLVPATLLLTWVGGWPFFILIIACAGLLAREWARLCGAPSVPAGWFLAGGIMLLITAAVVEHRHLAAGMAGFGLAIGVMILTAKKLGAKRAGWLAVGVAAILPAGLSLVWMRSLEPEGLALILWVMAVVWAADSGAYAVGRTVGGPRLAPRISPTKTWSGLAGGLVAAGLIGGVVALLLGDGAFALAAIAGMLVGAASGLGDLFESHVKRTFKAKDSGGLIPGHGGVLDRLDSLLAAAPVTAALYLAGWRWL